MLSQAFELLHQQQYTEAVQSFLKCSLTNQDLYKIITVYREQLNYNHSLFFTTQLIICYVIKAQSTDALAQYNLACLYMHGYGVEQNLNESRRLFKLCAYLLTDKEYHDIAYIVSMMFQHGFIVDKDIDESNRLIKLSKGEIKINKIKYKNNSCQLFLKLFTF
jgi:TPR repeat protein